MPVAAPRISFITRTKDRPLLLERAIKSIISQSHENWEMVISNDGGNDRPVDKLVNKYHKYLNGKVQVIHHPTSSGMEAASNRGLKVASGKYVVIHDDDDSLHPCFAERMIEFAEKNASVGVVCHSIRVLETLRDDKVFINRRDLFNEELPTINLYKIMENNMFPPISFMYRREVFKKIGYYDESLPVLGDWDFNIRFMAEYDIDVLTEPLAFYHHRLTASGIYGNSVIAGLDRHVKYLNVLRSRYLRKDLTAGNSSIGELFNLSQSIKALRD